MHHSLSRTRWGKLGSAAENVVSWGKGRRGWLWHGVGVAWRAAKAIIRYVPECESAAGNAAACRGDKGSTYVAWSRIISMSRNNVACNAAKQ